MFCCSRPNIYCSCYLNVVCIHCVHTVIIKGSAINLTHLISLYEILSIHIDTSHMLQSSENL